MTALDRQIRQEDESPSIGIILCKEKNRTIVEYALHDAPKPIGVATYQITKKLPKTLEGQLPSPKDIARLLVVYEEGRKVESSDGCRAHRSPTWAEKRMILLNWWTAGLSAFRLIASAFCPKRPISSCKA